MVACLILVLVLCLFLADVGLYLAARNRAQDAADAAALAAVAEAFPLFSSGDDPSSAASRLSKANNASLEKIDVSPGNDRVQVDVSVRTSSLLLGRLGIGPEKVRARAAAEIDLDALLASRQVWFTADPATLENLKKILTSGGAINWSRASTLVALLALSHLGKPYVWGAEGPDSFDCSGLVCYVYAQIGLGLPRTTFAMVRVGKAVSVGELAPGDLVFFRGNAHVGMYIGGGWFVHSPHTGDVVKLATLNSRSDISACRRVL